MEVLPEYIRVNTPKVAAKLMDGEVVVINLATGVYYTLDGLGASVWSLIENGGSVDSMVGWVARGWNVEPDRAREELTPFFNLLLEEEIVVAAEPDSGAAAPPPPEPASLLPIARPELSIYRDMEELLALDPPVPGMATVPWNDPETGRQGG
jgi:hypothetical protein